MLEGEEDDEEIEESAHICADEGNGLEMSCGGRGDSIPMMKPMIAPTAGRMRLSDGIIIVLNCEHARNKKKAYFRP